MVQRYEDKHQIDEENIQEIHKTYFGKYNRDIQCDYHINHGSKIYAKTYECGRVYAIHTRTHLTYQVRQWIDDIKECMSFLMYEGF